MDCIKALLSLLVVIVVSATIERACLPASTTTYSNNASGVA